MKNYITKILISIGTLSLIFIGANSVSALDCNSTWTTPVGCNSGYIEYDYFDQSYNQPYNQYDQYGYTQPVPTTQYRVVQSQAQRPVVNNYYYQTTGSTNKVASSTTTKTVAKTTDKTDTSSSDKSATDNQNDSEDVFNSDQSYYNGLTALSFRGDGGFLPSSFWQWLLVIVLILAIVIIVRLINRSSYKEVHSIPAH